MTQKLPQYFEELINTKFAETNKKIDELARVKDDIKTLQRQILWVVVALAVLFLLHIDDLGPTFLGSLRSFIGL